MELAVYPKNKTRRSHCQCGDRGMTSLPGYRHILTNLFYLLRNNKSPTGAQMCINIIHILSLPEAPTVLCPTRRRPLAWFSKRILSKWRRGRGHPNELLTEVDNGYEHCRFLGEKTHAKMDATCSLAPTWPLWLWVKTRVSGLRLT